MLRVRNLIALDYDNVLMRSEFENITGAYTEAFLALGRRIEELLEETAREADNS